MKIFFIIHGFVQGLGYRAFVRGVAEKHGIVGFVRNAEDGSVHIFAEGSEDELKDFEKEINVTMRYGLSVHKIEKYEEGQLGFPKAIKDYNKFVVER